MLQFMQKYKTSDVLIKVNLKDLGLGPDATARDLWEHKDLGSIKNTLSADVGEHGVVFLKLR